MLLVCDVGNTNTVIGAYLEDKLVEHWRVSSVDNRTSDEWLLLLRQLLDLATSARPAPQAAILSSVVPPLTEVLAKALGRLCHRPTLIVGPGTKTGMPILTENPKEVGADRIVNAVAAYERYQQALIVVDMGTATTWDCISGRGEYLGGAIAPGVGISMDALFSHAAKLPRVSFSRPKNIIGRNTVEAMQSGLFWGYLSLVEGLVKRLRQEMNEEVMVVATGGLASLLDQHSTCINSVDSQLTLDGLHILFQRNQPA